MPKLRAGAGDPPFNSRRSIEYGVGMPVLESHSHDEFNAFGQVWTILQDHRGIMYFGVSGGDVLEYDGVSWRKIDIAMEIVRSLAIDDSGKIWVGGNGGFGYLEPDAAGTLHYVSLLDKVPENDRSFTDVYQTLITPKGVFFRSFELLFRWNGESMHVWRPVSGSRFQALSAVRGHIYTAQNGIGLQEIVGDDIRNLPGGDAFRNSNKLFLHAYDDTHLLVTQRDGMLQLYDGQKVTPFATQADDYLKKHKVYTSTLLKDGGICITTLTGGDVILGHDGSLRQVIDVAEGLLDPDALSSFQDRDGALWIGTTDGISRVEIASPISLFSHTGALDAVRFQGSVYVANGGGSVPVQKLVFDPKTNRPSLVSIGGATQGFDLMVFRDHLGNTPDQLLVSTSEGVTKVEGNALVPALPLLHSLSEQVYTTRQSTKTPNRVFIGHGDGVASMRWDGHQWIDEGRLPNTIFEVRTIAEDADGKLWVGGTKGKVLRITVAPTGMRDSKAEVISSKEGLPSGLTGVSFAFGNLYTVIDRVKSIYRWDPAAHRFVVDNQLLLLMDAHDASPQIYHLDDGSVWACTLSSEGRRIARVLRNADGSLRLDENTYRPLTRFKVYPAFVDPDGSVWAVGEQLIRFNPKLENAAAEQFPPLVRQVNAGSSIVFGGEAVSGAAEPRLPSGTNAVRFQFASTDYKDSVDTTYQYFLEGADKDWSIWENQKEANFSGLGPGKYLFLVRTRSIDGRISPEGILRLLILPPWYRPTLAYILYVLLFLFITYVAWKLITMHERNKARRKTGFLKIRPRRLEATVTERTQEIRAQASEIAAQKDSIELLSDIGKEITASLDLNTILFKLYERVNQIVDASIFGVGLYRPEKHLIEYSLAIENGKRYAPYTRSTDDKNQFAVWCIDHRQPILLNDVAAESTKYIAGYQHSGGES